MHDHRAHLEYQLFRKLRQEDSLSSRPAWAAQTVSQKKKKEKKEKKIKIISWKSYLDCPIHS
jgi:hypothetical protein